jgi:hypothetical protein
MSELQIYTFKLKRPYASGVIVTLAATLKEAQEMAFSELDGYDRDIYSIAGPDSLTDYEMKPIKSGVVVFHSYAE